MTAIVTLAAVGFPSHPTSNAVWPLARASAESLSVTIRAPGVATRIGLATVVIIPGPLGSAFSMRHVTSALAARGVRSIVADPLGMGTSSRSAQADYSLARQAERIATVLDTLHVSRAVLVGHGTGASVALRRAALRPNVVAGILSTSGGPVDRQGTRGVKLALSFSRLIDTPPGRMLARRQFRGAVREQSFDDAWCTAYALHAYLAPVERDVKAYLRALYAMSTAVEPSPIAAALTHVRAPLRVIVGAMRTPSTPTDAQLALLVNTLPTMRVDTGERSGTMQHEGRPVEVAERILALLVRYSTAPGDD